MHTVFRGCFLSLYMLEFFVRYEVTETFLCVTPEVSWY